MTFQAAQSASRVCPGVYWEDEYPIPVRTFCTGVPVFIGYTETGAYLQPRPVSRYAQFAAHFGGSLHGGFLAATIRGFFENGGTLCYVVRQEKKPGVEQALEETLHVLKALEEIDLVCAPELMAEHAETAVALQQMVLEHCDRAANRFAILDSLPGAGLRGALEKQWRELAGKNAALYFPWL